MGFANRISWTRYWKFSRWKNTLDNGQAEMAALQPGQAIDDDDDEDDDDQYRPTFSKNS